jgi:hypothetical protein
VVEAVELSFFCNQEEQPKRQAIEQEPESDYIDPMEFSLNSGTYYFGLRDLKSGVPFGTVDLQVGSRMVPD